ncbi:unnamed protein product [Ophioblennius macclurei]
MEVMRRTCESIFPTLKQQCPDGHMVLLWSVAWGRLLYFHVSLEGNDDLRPYPSLSKLPPFPIPPTSSTLPSPLQREPKVWVLNLCGPLVWWPWL